MEQAMSVINRQRSELEELQKQMRDLKQDLWHANNPDTDQESVVRNDTTPTAPHAESFRPVPQLGSDTTHPGSLTSKVDPGVHPKLTDHIKGSDRESSFFSLNYVKMLSLEKLTGLNSGTNVRTFCRKVEWLLKKDDHRVEAALSRMESPVDEMILEELDSRGTWDWNNLKQALTKFSTGQSTLGNPWTDFF
ncbi:hypothetical protein Hamer_G004657 [Homarus americanus]|uniref:Uncharacterized protein n=1 Tax=Homarus americanus TaxID=6706 RepID=A0A8J5K4T4_HOMAM|nr:hypothetical protein Hamer_G004657 [Homarus americanus]